MVGLAALAAVALVAFRWARRPPPPSCRALDERTVQLGEQDRWGFDEGGRLVLAREVDKALRLEREVAGGGLGPVPSSPHLALLQNGFDHVLPFGILLGDAPMIALIGMRTPTPELDGHGALFVLYDANSWNMQRLFGPISGVAVERFRKEVVIVTTTVATPPRPLGLAPGVDAYFPARKHPRPLPLEIGEAHGPSIATSEDRIAVVYSAQKQVHFLLADGDGKKVGDTHVVATTESLAAVAFDGKVATVMWAAEKSGRSRLVGRSIVLGEPEFGPERVLADEPVSRFSIARTATGRTLVAWVTSSGGDSVVRLSPLRADGTLATPAVLGRSTDVRYVLGTPDGQDPPAVAWKDAQNALHVTRVACAEPSK